jgi:hypothetical protein
MDKHSDATVPAAIWSRADLIGEHYDTVLARLHAFLRPRTYLEIGVSKGATLALAQCPTIGIDPQFEIDRPVVSGKSMCCLFQMPSDRFFENHNPKAMFGKPIDMAFLDGMHLFEFLLRDFLNVERHCRRESVVLLHDCVPPDEYVARRDQADHRLREHSAHPDWWAGDVWKVLSILRIHRPDLRVVVFDAHPTGLVAVTNLNPASEMLSDLYFHLVAQYKDITLREQNDKRMAPLSMLETQAYATFDAMSSLFWL